MDDTGGPTWDTRERAFEAWKHHEGIGGADKNTMIKIVTWLLGFSSAIIGVYATGQVKDGYAAVLLILLGAFFSFLAAFTALLYGAYAARNWAIADRIAKDSRLREQRPDYNPFEKSNVSPLSKWVRGLGNPCEGRIAPVFWVFFGVSIASFSVYLTLLLHLARKCS